MFKKQFMHNNICNYRKRDRGLHDVELNQVIVTKNPTNKGAKIMQV